MNQIILASHGGLSEGMKNTVEMMLGELPNLHSVATTRDETEPITVVVRRLLDNFNPLDKVYVVTDILGGSVNNNMLSLLGDYPNLTVLCGMNAALVLTLASMKDPMNEEELDECIQQMRQQIINCSKMLQNTAIEEDDL